MSLKAYEENDIKNIANAIRNHNITGNFTVAEMASNIDNIQGGGNYGTLNVIANGTYTPQSPIDAWNEVNVQVPTSMPLDLITCNRQYLPSSSEVRIEDALVVSGISGNKISLQGAFRFPYMVNCLGTDTLKTTLSSITNYSVVETVFSNMKFNMSDVFYNIIDDLHYCNNIITNSELFDDNFVLNASRFTISNIKFLGNYFEFYYPYSISNIARAGLSGNFNINNNGSTIHFNFQTPMSYLNANGTGLFNGLSQLSTHFNMKLTFGQIQEISFPTLGSLPANGNLILSAGKSTDRTIVHYQNGTVLFHVREGGIYDRFDLYVEGNLSFASYGTPQQGGRRIFEGSKLHTVYGKFNVYSGTELFNNCQNAKINIENIHFEPKDVTGSFATIGFNSFANNVNWLGGNAILSDMGKKDTSLMFVAQQFVCPYTRINNTYLLTRCIGGISTYGGVKSVIFENFAPVAANNALWTVGYNNYSLAWKNNIDFVYDRITGMYSRWIMNINESVSRDLNLVVTNEYDFNQSLISSSAGLLDMVRVVEDTSITPFTHSVPTLDDNGNLISYNYNITRLATLMNGSDYVINVMFGTREV